MSAILRQLFRTACWVGFVGVAALYAYGAPRSGNKSSVRGVAQRRPRDAVAAKSAARAQFFVDHPRAKLFPPSGRVERVYGVAFGSGDSPEATGDHFRRKYASMFGVRPDDLVTAGPLFDQRHTQPVMYDARTGRYKFTLVYFTQRVGGVPVFGADLRLLVRNAPGFELVLVSNGLRDLGDFSIAGNAVHDPSVSVERVKADYPTLTQFGEPELVVWAGVNDDDVTPTVAFSFVAHDSGVGGATQEAWRFVTRADTGAILHRENLIYEVDVTGNISAQVTQGAGSDLCEPEALEALPYAAASIGATTAFADVNGDFTIPNAGSADVVVESRVRGRWFAVSNVTGTDAVLTQTVTPPGPADFVHNAANGSELTRAEVNGYVEANVVRDLAIAANPAYPTLNTPVGSPFPVNVNLAQSCNAFYSPVNQTINFYTSGGGCPNTASTTVVHHEYGHHLVQVAGSGQGQYGEGMGDVLAVINTDQPLLAPGWNTASCTSSLRRADTGLQYPCTSAGAGHNCAPLMSGCVWDTLAELRLTEPVNYTQIMGGLAVNAILMHTGTEITPSITIDYLTLDDDDGDLGNGTPHSVEIETGFGAHNMIPVPAPPNDVCSGATTVTCGDTDTIFVSDGYTSGGTGNDPTSSCELANGGPFTHDASWWYEFVAPAGADGLTISMCNTAVSEDPVLSIFTSTSSCGALTELACDDDACAPGFVPSELTTPITAGQTYLVLVNRYTNGTGGDLPYIIDFTCTGATCTPADCDDGNVCTTDVCNSGTCVNTNNTIACDDGDLCTQSDTCSGGACSGTPIDCSALDDDCNIGMCNAGSGACFAQSSNEGGACNTAMGCLAGTCQTGVCVPTDTVAPSITCAADVTVNSDAGGCFAMVTPGAPTVSDDCSAAPNIGVSFVRSDGKVNLTDSYDAVDSPITITWTATDEVGNPAQCTQTVTVSSFNELVVDVELAPAVEPLMTRCVSFELFDCIGGGPPETIEQEIAFTDGVASGVGALVACGSYDCITARDPLHTLRRTDLSFGIVGTQYRSDFTVTGGTGDSSLVGGNLNGDGFIDIFDFGVFAGQWNVNYGSGNSTCPATGTNADVSGNGLVFSEDFTFIQINFLDGDDANCCGLAAAQRGPVTSISVAELRQRGLESHIAGDINGDGWLDVTDMVDWMTGAQPDASEIRTGDSQDRGGGS